MSPSCRLHLNSHLLISYFAVQLDTVIKHYEWDLGQILFSVDEQAHSEEWLAAMEDNIGKSTLMTIRHSLAVEQLSSIWQFIFGLLSLGIAVSLAVLLGDVILTRHFLTLRQRVTRWVTLLLPESVRALMQPPPLPEAAA
jgi:hypothetical protein